MPAEFSHRFPFPTESGDMLVLLVLLQRGDLSCLPRRFTTPIKPPAQLSRGILGRLHSPVSSCCCQGMSQQPTVISLSCSNYIKLEQAIDACSKQYKSVSSEKEVSFSLYQLLDFDHC